MNNNDNYSSSPSEGSADEVLQDLMPKLGMEATDPKENYKKQARRKYILPKILIVCLVLALILSAVAVLRLSVRFHDLDVAEEPTKASVTFRLDRLALLESVTAMLGSSPVDVNLVSPGNYQLDATRNGELVITARTFMDRPSSITVTIDCIDEEPPHIDHDELIDGDVYIYITDGEDGSGIDWETLQSTVASSGAHFELKEINEDESYISFPLPDESVRVYVEDLNGNPLSMRLDRSHLDG